MMNIKIALFAVIMIFVNGCATQNTNSFNANYLDKLMSKYEGQTLTPNDISQIHLDENLDHSYKMIDLENNQVYSYNYLGTKNDLLQFEIVTSPLYLKEVISLNKNAQFVKSTLFSYDKSCTFVLGLCERIRQTVNGVQNKERVETSFENGIWVIKVFREINNKLVLHSLTHSVYDKKGLPIYNKAFSGGHKLVAEFARAQ